ncbi:MAG TPA: ELWxxDGT repeat protein, partial [Bryobacteraceae bacterium]|nr:ELWxxDGT repeat protein [Bryobacteraceae bacterium]
MLAFDVIQLADARPGPAGSAPQELTVVGGTMFFSAENVAGNRELWKSDGTPSGTLQIEEIFYSEHASYPSQLTPFNGLLYFQAHTNSGSPIGRELWRSDGTAAGTFLVKNIYFGSGGAFDAPPTTRTPFAVMNDAFYFRANDGVHGVELWRSNGTEAGTTRVTDINPGDASANVRDLTVIGNTLYFVADNGAGSQLWRTDGTPGVAAMVKDIRPGGDAELAYLTPMGDALYFRANDGITGIELWKSDGTAEGTVRVKDIRPGGPTSSAFPNELTNVNGTLFFTAIDAGGNRELHKSDGTTLGTIKVKEINAGLASADPKELTEMGGALYFTANDGAARRLFRSDGSDAGTASIVAATNPASLAALNGTLFFAAESPGAGVELWSYTAGAAPLVATQNIAADATSSSPREMVDFAGRLFLVATTPGSGTEVFRQSPASYGNYADDRRVDGMDFVAWQRSLGGASTAVDGDRSGVVDANDLNIWRANFGFAFPPLPDPPTGGPTSSGGGLAYIPPISFIPATHLVAAGESSVPSDRAAAIARPEPDEVRDAAFAQFA